MDDGRCSISIVALMGSQNVLCLVKQEQNDLNRCSSYSESPVGFFARICNGIRLRDFQIDRRILKTCTHRVYAFEAFPTTRLTLCTACLTVMFTGLCWFSAVFAVPASTRPDRAHGLREYSAGWLRVIARYDFEVC
jgi:hypothetical protein